MAAGACLLGIGTLVSAALPQPAVDVGVASCASLAFVGALLVGVPAGRRSIHRDVWGRYLVALLVAAVGAAVALHLPGSSIPMTVGALPGMLLTVRPLPRLLPPGTWHRLRAQLVTSLLLFVVACLLCALAVFELLAGRTLRLDSAFDATLAALFATLALMVAVGLLVVSATTGGLRRVAVLALTGQVAVSAGVVLMAFSDEAQAASPPLIATSVCAIAALALLVSAALLDREHDRPSDAAALPVLPALLPHVTATTGGLLLLVGVLVHGRLGVAQTVLAGVGLLLLTVHQWVTLRDGRDLTHRLQRSEAYFRAVVRSAVDPVIILDADLTITWSSPSFTAMLGRGPERIVGADVRVAVHPDDRAALAAGLLAPQDDADREGRTITGRVRHDDGRWRLVQSRVRDLRDDPDVGALVLYCRDVTRDDAPGAAPGTAPAVVAETGGVDPDTGLPDRSALVVRLADLARTRTPAALVKIWVSGLADTHRGTPAPPEALVDLAGRFARVLRTGDELWRTGTQEFTVLVQGSISDAETLAHRLVGTVPADAPVHGVRLSASAGITGLQDGDPEPVQVLRRAGMALESARTAGPGRVRRHSVASLIAQNRREALRADLAVALGRGELRMVYQPVVDLVLQRPGSAEALMRWQHPTWGAVSPGEFVPLAEESTMVVELGRWALRTATAQVAGLGRPDLAVAVNVAARHVRSGQLLTDVQDALQASGLPAGRLTLELTESVLLDDAHVTDELEALRRLGVRIAVDDFGTGWSSLAYLVGLPIDVLKMDRQFLASLESDPRHQALCRSVLHLGSSLGLDVVVEGVETPRELQLLRDMGHRFVQGFLLARPTELPALAGVLDDVPAAVTGAPGALR
ncbi:PAS domain S-box-containing protein [Klenkia marina]|uniref:PAS domain S-box-containing protein n=1 Tax=Klenkia marina TaxID=1960309 RepID=A0A1G4XG54_9ACTN|nr:EAL domain-containing protein [Klenkia marina]SCX40213.1 PAS domain S-box-containing protein [Klenkia marina]